MKIALVHSFYASGQPSGENETVHDQMAALRAAGHEVELVAARTDDLVSEPLYPVRAAARVATGRGRSPLAALRALAPDVVHVHNLFPNFGRTWAREWPGPLVATLHNHRPLCAAATLYRAGAPCTRCPDGDRWAGLRFGCYRDSRTATAPLAWAGRSGGGRDPLLARADRLVVLSERSRAMYEQSGVAAERLALVPNFVPFHRSSAEGPPNGDGGRWIFVGRLTEGKGLLELLRQWPEGAALDVAGTGELLDRAREIAPPGVRFLGQLDRSELRTRLPQCRGLVFPGLGWEAACPPLVVLEALAAGLPVLTFEGTSVAEVVREQGTGLVAAAHTALSDALAQAAARFPALRGHCARVFEERYAQPVWVRRMTALYEHVSASHQGVTAHEVSQQ